MTITVDHDQAPVGVITLNRPDAHNAMNAEMIRALSDAFSEQISGPDIRVIHLRANGKHFSAGADLKWMQQSLELKFEENCADARQLALLLEKIHRSPKPIVASVQGSSYGGALGLIACADIVFATTSATFCLSEVKLGLAPSVISPYVIQAMGPRQTLRYMLSAEVMGAAAAKANHLIHEIVAPDELETMSVQLCKQLTNNGPGAMKSCKSLVKKIAPTLCEDIQQYTVETIARLRASKEGQEGIKAFFEKRQPSWFKENK